MKQMTCAQMGGPATCDTVMTATTAEEMVAEGMKHVEAAHPEMLVDIKAMSPEDNEKWRAEFQTKWDAIPETEPTA